MDKERTWKILDVMAPIAKAYMDVALHVSRLSHGSWAKPVVTSVIIGAKRLSTSFRTISRRLRTHTHPEDELRQLDEVSALAPEYPGWVLTFQGADRLEPVDRWARFREASKPH